MGASGKILSERGAYIVLFALWLLATALNIAKPFHLDDTAHLLIAEQIANAPLHPMSGLVNWLDTAEPVFVTNQPHFFYYLIAGVVAVFGPSELALHLFLSMFTGLAIWVSYALGRRFVPQYALIITATLVLSPGFLINQNVMADVPLLAMMGLAVLILTGPMGDHKTGAKGFGVFSLALLTKYTALFLFPALIIAAMRKRRVLVGSLLPVVALALWSLFNIYDYGAAHILNRPANAGGLFPSPKLTFALICNMGIFAVPPAIWLMTSARLKWVWVGIWVVSFAAFYVVTLKLLHLAYEPLMPLNAGLFASAMVLGGAVALRVGQLALALWHDRARLGGWLLENLGEITLLAWLAGGGVFLATFPPFMATRHALLLVLPLFILALRAQPLNIGRRTAVSVLLVWGLIGVFTTANDIRFAGFYRDMAPVVAARATGLAGHNARVFTRGHWGWQWYARQSGMLEYDSVRSQLRVGDILVDPVDISSQFVADLDDYVVIDRVLQTPSVFGVFDTHRFYASGAVASPVFAAGFAREIRILRKEK